MIAQPYQLYVERKDPTKNMARYYAMSIEPTLFGQACLVRRWGRIGVRGQRLYIISSVRRKRSTSSSRFSGRSARTDTD
jgi:predicted DNA-binding WGR domain protein